MGLGFLMLALWMLNYSLVVSANAESDALIALKFSLSDPYNILVSWDAELDDPCTWYNVTCNIDNSVTQVYLLDANLSGQLVPQLGSLPNLEHLELSSNNIGGKIPPELGNLTNLVSLNLYQNNLSGPIPDELGKLWRLRILRLNNNTLSGVIPMSLTTISSLQLLDLSYNNLSGSVPINGSFYLLTPMSFAGNPNITIPEGVGVGNGATGAIAEVGVRNGTTGAIAGGIAAGAILLFAALATTLVWWRKRKDCDHFFDVSAEDDPEIQLGALYWFSPRTLTRFSLGELEVMTDNFDPENIVGRGGFGEVYKGCLTDGSLVAVKKLKGVHNKVQELQFQTEVEMISLVDHRNLLRLQGFCMTLTEKFLVYPFMANGSVASCLKACQGSQPLLDWPKRKHIALGSARGLAYLHHFDPTVIHRDVKAANILLDEEFEAVVGDFGLAKLMDFKDSHDNTVVCGTIGHIAPEYFNERKCSEKTDVFGYGVMLLELTSGHKATDLAQVAIDDGFMLHEWVKGLLKEKKLERLVDEKLQGNYVEEEVEQLIQVALLCTQSSPLQRPTMFEVVRMLQGDGLAKRWEQWQKQQVFYQDSNHALRPHVAWIVDSTSQLRPDEVSGPR